MSEYVRCGDDAPCSVASDLRARVRELEGSGFMLPEPKPATPIPPDPRDAVVKAADDYERLWMKVHGADGATPDDRVMLGYVRGHLFGTIRNLRATEGL